MSNPRKITDLEEFAIGQIWSPYLPMLPDYVEGTYRKAGRAYIRGMARRYGPDFLTATVAMLQENPTIAVLVANRLYRIGDTMPDYIQHPLADWYREVMEVES